MAGVGRGRGHDRRGRGRPDRRRPPRGRAPPARAPGSEGRQLLGGVERHRDRLRRRPDLRRAASPRRARVLGLRLGRPVPPDRRREEGRGVPLAAQVPRRAVDAGSPGREAVAAADRRALGAGWRDDRVRQPHLPELPPGPRGPRGGGHAGDRRLDPRRARVRAQGCRRRRGDPAAGGRLRPPRARVVGAQPAAAHPRRRGAGAPRDRLLRRAPPARMAARRLRRRRPQRPVRDPGAQRMLLRRAVHPSHPPDRRRRGRRPWTSRPGRDTRARRSGSPG